MWRSYISTTVADTAAVHFICVLFGASFFYHFHWTLLFSALFVLVTDVRPLRLYKKRQQALHQLKKHREDENEETHATRGVQVEECHPHLSHSAEMIHDKDDGDRAEDDPLVILHEVMATREQVFVVLALGGSLLAPLDWAVWWQEWPIPSSVLVACGVVCELVYNQFTEPSRHIRKTSSGPI